MDVARLTAGVRDLGDRLLSRLVVSFEDELANDYLIMSFRVAAGPDHEKELECIERFGKEVIAAYRAG